MNERGENSAQPPVWGGQPYGDQQPRPQAYAPQPGAYYPGQDQGAGGYQQPPTAFGAPVPDQAPAKRRPKWKTPLIALVSLGIGIGIGAASAGGSNSPDSSSTAAGSTSGSTPTAAASHAAAKAPASTKAAAPPAPATSVVLTAKGTGMKSTKQFTVADNWSLKYTYDCSSDGGEGNFIVSEAGGDNDGIPIVNELGKKGSDVTYQHSDSGTHSLDVNSECDWTITVTSGDAG